jgi:WD40 repeat protein
VERLWRWVRRNPLVASLSAVVLLVTLGGFFGVLGQWQVALANERKADEKAVQAQENEHEANQQRNAAQQERDELLTLKGTGHVAAFSPDGKRLASASGGGGPGAIGEVKVWDAQTGKELLSLKGHTAGVSSVVFSPDGTRLASGSGSPTGGPMGEVMVWDAQTGQELLSLKGGRYGHGVAFSPNGHWLASDAGRTVKIYDATPLSENP